MSVPSLRTSSNGKELSRLLSAAVVNQKFCRLLLSNPATALATGYNGESFRLGQEDQELVLSIEAKNLADFARQLTKVQASPIRTTKSPVMAAYQL